jgi:hypothetical protein
MQIFTEPNLTVIASEDMPTELILNCHSSWGQVCKGSVTHLTYNEATEQNLLFGSSIDLAIATVKNKILTFPSFYTNEPFTELWGIPVKGAFKDQYSSNASVFITTMLRTRSADLFNQMKKTWEDEAYKQYFSDNSKEKQDIKEYIISYLYEQIANKIFCFELVKEASKTPYYYVKSTTRKPENEMETDALIIARKIHANNPNLCQLAYREKIHKECLADLKKKNKQLPSG